MTSKGGRFVIYGKLKFKQPIFIKIERKITEGILILYTEAHKLYEENFGTSEEKLSNAAFQLCAKGMMNNTD